MKALVQELDLKDITFFLPGLGWFDGFRIAAEHEERFKRLWRPIHSCPPANKKHRRRSSSGNNFLKIRLF
ncbi:MAG: hypothetical protein CM1200mP10_06980 [Candidatus Neomarinimicrobiota bacterium]|nr:MAG: hypothetical protein CM1200mP10_06980 [Candidatus Neomarinimicrobiota bacterium]